MYILFTTRLHLSALRDSSAEEACARASDACASKFKYALTYILTRIIPAHTCCTCRTITHMHSSKPWSNREVLIKSAGVKARLKHHHVGVHRDAASPLHLRAYEHACVFVSMYVCMHACVNERVCLSICTRMLHPYTEACAHTPLRPH